MVVRSALLIYLILSSVANAGAWLQPQGKGMAVLNATTFSADSYFDADGNEQPQDRFEKHEANLYAEYGANENWTVGTNLFFNRVEQSGGQNNGLADSELFARRKLYKTQKNILSLQPLIKLRSYYNNDAPPRGGSTSTDAELSLLAGTKTPLVNAEDYVDARLGYRTRNHDLANQIRYDVSMGLHIMPQVQIIPAIRGVVVENPNDTQTFREDGEQDSQWLKAEITALYTLHESAWLQASLFQHVMGEQSGAGRGISIGAGRRF